MVTEGEFNLLFVRAETVHTKTGKIRFIQSLVGTKSVPGPRLRRLRFQVVRITGHFHYGQGKVGFPGAVVPFIDSLKFPVRSSNVVLVSVDGLKFGISLWITLAGYCTENIYQISRIIGHYEIPLGGGGIQMEDVAFKWRINLWFHRKRLLIASA